MFEVIRHSIVDLNLFGGLLLVPMLWLCYFGAAALTIVSANPDFSMGRPQFMVVMLTAFGILQISTGTRIAGLTAIGSDAFILHHVLNLATAAAFGALITMAAVARRKDAGLAPSLDWYVVVFPVVLVSLLGARPSDRSGPALRKVPFRRKLWAVYLGFFSIMLSILISEYIAGAAGEVMDDDVVAWSNMESRIRYFGRDTVVEMVATELPTGRIAVEGSRKWLAIEVDPDILTSLEDESADEVNIKDVCDHPIFGSLLESGAEIEFSSNGENDADSIWVTMSDCRSEG